MNENQNHSHAWITDAVTWTAPGMGLDPLWRQLMDGRTAIGPVQRFSTTNYVSRVAALLDGWHPDKASSMIYSILESVLDQLGPIPRDTVVLTATTKAGIDNLEKLRNKSPARVQDLLLTAIGDAVTDRLGLEKQPGVNISAACASSAFAVARAAAMIRSGRARSVLVVCLDLISEFVFSGFSCIGALSPHPSKPFDRDRSGLSLGEGGAAILLMAASRARQENRPCLGVVAGWGGACDAAHITAPARDGCGLIQAMQQALNTAAIRPEQVGAILAHGTGTKYNDSMELTAFEQVFGDRVLPVVSVKGAIGHTLGAAGGIEVALGCRMLQEQLAPPTVGFRHPEGWAESRVRQGPMAFSGDYLISTNSGFGGINAALVLKKGTSP